MKLKILWVIAVVLIPRPVSAQITDDASWAPTGVSVVDISPGAPLDRIAASRRIRSTFGPGPGSRNLFSTDQQFPRLPTI
jgi:hypothetical protein